MEFIDNVVINANSQADTITLNSAADPVTINGGAGADTINVRTASTTVTVNTGTENDTVTLGSAAPSLYGTMTNLNGVVTVNGGDTDILNLGDGSSGTGIVGTLTLSGGTRSISTTQYQVLLTGSPLGGGLTYYLGTGTDLLVVGSTQAGEPIRLYGNGNSDQIHIGGGDVRNIDGPVFVGTTSGDVQLGIDNSDDPNSYAAVTLSPSAVTGLAGATISYEEVQIGRVTLIGSGGADTITLSGAWSNPTASDLVPRFVDGAAGNDIFKISTDLSLDGGAIDGDTGSDTISYELWNSGVSVDLALNAAPNVPIMTAVDNVTGSTGNDHLRGNLANNNFNGLGGTDTISSEGDYDFWLTNSQLERTGQDTDGLSNMEFVSLVGSNNGRTMYAYNSSLNTAFFGNGGNDWLIGGSGNNSISGGDGDDTVLGSLGNDTLSGGTHNDMLWEYNDVSS